MPLQIRCERRGYLAEEVPGVRRRQGRIELHVGVSGKGNRTGNDSYRRGADWSFWEEQWF